MQYLSTQYCNEKLWQIQTLHTYNQGQGSGQAGRWYCVPNISEFTQQNELLVNYHFLISFNVCPPNPKNGSTAIVVQVHSTTQLMFMFKPENFSFLLSTFAQITFSLQYSDQPRARHAVRMCGPHQHFGEKNVRYCALTRTQFLHQFL